MAVNTYDGKIYIKKDDGTETIVEVGVGAGFAEDTHEPTGFINRTDSTISFSNANRRLTIAPAVTDYAVYIEGVKQVISTTKTFDITDTEGHHYVYIDSDGDLQELVNDWDPEILLKQSAYLAAIYWDTTNDEIVYFGDERHGITMDWATHAHFHTAFGAQYIDGFALGNFDIDGTGNTDSHAQLSVDNGNLRDEDLLHFVQDGSPQDLSPIAQIPVLYRVNANGDFRINTVTNFPITTTGTGRAAYNEWTGTVWQVAEVTSGNFVLMHFYATNDVNNPVISLMGQNEYTTVANARDGANSEIGEIGVLPYEEFIPLASVIFQTKDSYSNTVNSRIISTDAGEDYVDWRTAKLQPGIPQGNHNSLAGRSDDGAHPSSALTYSNTTSGLTAATAQAAIDELEVKKVDEEILNTSESNSENWVKICTIDGVDSTTGAHLHGSLTGLGNYSGNEKATIFFNFSQYNDEYVVRAYALNKDKIDGTIKIYVKQIDPYEFELWIQLPQYNLNPTLLVESQANVIVDCNTLETHSIMGTRYDYWLEKTVGSNVRMSVENASTSPTDTVFTQIITMKTANLSGDTDFTWSKESGGVQNNNVMWLDTDDNLRYQFMSNAYNYDGTYNDNLPHRWGFVYNSVAQTLKLYWDGVLTNTWTSVDNGAAFRIGYLFDSSTASDQSMRNVQRWSSEFDDTQMLYDYEHESNALYKAGSNLYSDNPGIDTADLEQWFPCNEGTGTLLENVATSTTYLISSGLSWVEETTPEDDELVYNIQHDWSPIITNPIVLTEDFTLQDGMSGAVVTGFTIEDGVTLTIPDGSTLSVV